MQLMFEFVNEVCPLLGEHDVPVLVVVTKGKVSPNFRKVCHVLSGKHRTAKLVGKCMNCKFLPYPIPHPK